MIKDIIQENILAISIVGILLLTVIIIVGYILIKIRKNNEI